MNFDLVPQNALTKVDPTAVAAAESAKARIQSAYIMAMHRPRNVDQARINILQACKRPLFAERVEYSKPVGNKAIKGPSIRFAELAVREWGNVLVESQTVYEDDFIRRIKVTCTDLETNSSHSKEIQISKTVERKKSEGREVLGERTNTNGDKVFIVKATDDELHNKEAALISKAVRNEGLRLIPSDIIDEAMDTAKATLRDRDKADPQAAKKKLLDAFAEIGIKPKDLEEYLRHKTDNVAPGELEDLRGIYRALKDGEATWADYVQPTPVEQKTEEKKDELKKRIREKKTQEAPPVEVVDSAAETVNCPNSKEAVYISFCDKDCNQRYGCPAHDREPGMEG